VTNGRSERPAGSVETVRAEAEAEDVADAAEFADDADDAEVAEDDRPAAGLGA